MNRGTQWRSRSYGGTAFFLIALFFVSAFAFAALPAQAGEAGITNDISTSASTGGNSASGGEMSEGTPSGRVRVYSEVNGEVVTDIDEETEGSVEVHHEVTHTEQQGTNVQTTIDTHPESRQTEIRASSSAQEGEHEMEQSKEHMEQAATITEEQTTKEQSSFIYSWITNIFAYVLGFFK